MKMMFVKEESEENMSPETWRIKQEEPETWRIKHEEPETWDIIIISKFEAKTEWSDFSFVKLSYTIPNYVQIIK